MSPRWDRYFHRTCIAVALNSRCLSRQIGAIIVRDHSIISTGYNGPPRGVPHCPTRLGDSTLGNELFINKLKLELDVCPRVSLGYKSGDGLHLCIAAHAEANAIVNAARVGVSVLNTTLYLNTVIPCKNCMSLIINAGIKQIVCEKLDAYDEIGVWMARSTGVKLRTFNLEEE